LICENIINIVQESEWILHEYAFKSWRATWIMKPLAYQMGKMSIANSVQTLPY